MRLHKPVGDHRGGGFLDFQPLPKNFYIKHHIFQSVTSAHFQFLAAKLLDVYLRTK